ncbi:MAG: tol-pal system YbgF family protein [Burkholderiales bacterium]
MRAGIREARAQRQRHAAGMLAAIVSAVAAFLLLAVAKSAHAQVIDTIEVTRRGREAQVAIRFVTTVQYLRHSPPSRGRLVQVEFQVTGSLDSQIGGRLVSETRIVPGSDLAPPFEVRYVAARRALTVEFQREVSWRVSGGGDGRSILVHLPLAAPPAKPPAAPAKAPPPAAAKPAAPATPSPAMPSVSPEIERDGAALVARSREALQAGRATEAIELLNRALNLPPGEFSREAQELIGRAREANGEPAKAKAEYELYLKLHTDAAGVARVKERLAKLAEARAAPVAAREAKTEKSAYGSLSTTYYRGATKYDATLQPPQPGLQPDQVTLTSTDQSSFVTNVDVTGRYQAGPWDSRLVFRDTWTASLLAGDRNDNRLAAAYYEVNRKDRDFGLRLGRQSATGGGVLGRFDGASARLGLRPGIRLNAVGGRTVEYYAAPRRALFGGSIDFGPWDNGLTTSLYAIEQRLDGVVDRRAVGTEMRYFDPRRNAFLLFDYDVRFREVNIAMLQANWLTAAGSNLALLYDRRRAPPLQVSNVSGAFAGAPLRDLLGAGASYDELLGQAKAVTPLSELVSLGFTHPVTPRWQLGADVKRSRVGATGAVGQLGAAPDSGALWIYTVQGIGTGIANANDVLVASASLNRGRQFDGFTGSLAYVRVIDRWRLEAGLRYYDQTDLNDVQLRRWTPNARVGYRWRDTVTFEGEAGAEFTRTEGPLQSEDTRRHYFNVGVRWDFY